MRTKIKNLPHVIFLNIRKFIFILLFDFFLNCKFFKRLKILKFLLFFSIESGISILNKKYKGKTIKKGES